MTMITTGGSSSSLVITLPILNLIPARTTVSIDFLSDQNNITLPLNGILSSQSAEEKEITLTISFNDEDGNFFTGRIETIQPVGAFLTNALSFDNPSRGISSGMTFHVILSGPLEPTDQIIFTLPNFLLLQTSSHLNIPFNATGTAAAAAFSSCHWDLTSSQLICTVLNSIPANTSLVLRIPFGYFQTPMNGISHEDSILFTSTVLSMTVPIQATPITF
jgi:hypothetical protein